MAGKAGRSGGHNKKTIEQHRIDGTFRPGMLATRGEEIELRPLYFKPDAERRKPVPKRWIRGPFDQLAIEAGCWFDRGWAEYACEWIESRLMLVEGVWSGNPFKLMRWQRDIVCRLFGWVRRDPEWGMIVRRYRRALVMVPKKNGKSPFAAALGCYLAFGDSPEIGCDVAIIATDKIQASNVGKHCFRMVRRQPDLNERCSIHENIGRVVNNETDSLLRTLAHNPAQLEGINTNGIICDELHVWKDARVWDGIRYAGVSRPNFLQLAITTSGDDTQSLCYQQYEYAKGVQSGDIVDHEFFGQIYEADPDDDWTDPKTWKKANPSFGETIKLTELQASCTEAKHNTRLQNAFRRYRLNIWTQPEQAWLDAEYWKQCGAQFTEDDFAGQVAIMGLDLSKTRDLTAVVLMFRGEAGELYQLPYFWMPEEMAQRKNHQVGYMEWSKSGHLRLTPGDVVDYGCVFEDIRELSEMFAIEAVLYDPWNAEHFTQQIEEEIGIPRIQFQQSIKAFNSPCQEYERRIINGTLKHPNHPILNWQASHVMIKHDPNQNIRPVKRDKNDFRTIDGIVAGIMALAKASEEPQQGFCLSLS